jgi:hypothetical protein
VICIFERIFEGQVLVIEYLWHWYVTHWSAMLLYGRWWTETFPRNVQRASLSLRAVCQFAVHPGKKNLLCWSEWVNVRSELASMHRYRVSLPIPFGSCAHLSLSTRNNKWLLVAKFSSWMKDNGLLAGGSLTNDLRVCEYRSDNVARMWWDMVPMYYV